MTDARQLRDRLAAQVRETFAPYVAILAPRGRDASVATDLLDTRNIDTRVLLSLADLVGLIGPDIGAVLVTEEALDDPHYDALVDALHAQPAWSDLPFIVLANGAVGRRSDASAQRMEGLNNAVLLSRPLHAEELLRAVTSALTARRRQHEARVQLDELLLRTQALSESEAKFHAIAESVDQMIWSTRPDGFHDYYNKRWYDFTGLSDGSTDGEAWNGMVHDDDRDRAWDVWREALASGTTYEIEYRLRHHSGTFRWVLARAQPVMSAGGHILRWYGTCTDIHEEVIAREATVTDLTRQRDVVWDMAVDLIAVVNSDATLAGINDAWARLLGWTEADLVGRNFVTLTHPDDVERTLITFQAVFAAPLTDPYEFRLQHRDGSYRWFGWTASAEGQLVYAIGRDVTERIEKAKTLATTEAALRQSQKLEMIGQLTGGVAHDFNNLLMATRSSLDLLRRRLVGADDRTLSLIDNATKATERGAALTQRMLAFARKQELHAEPVDMALVIPELRDLLTRTLGPKIEIVIDVAPDVPQATVDLNQLEMALLNLAVNGRDAMDDAGQLTFRVDTSDGLRVPDLAPGTYVRIAVTDTGAGMDAATLAQATEPFFTTKGVGKGTGLGLSMIHGLAQQSGGSFTLHSQVGTGTTATLYLPAAAGDSADVTAASSGHTVALPSLPDLRRERLVILAVDDDILVSMGTVGVLEDLGHDVIEVHSGADALAALERRPDIDIVITDQAMPKMTGVALARQIRSTRPDMPIILATGYAEMPEGGHDFITERLEKPFSDAALERVLRRFQAS